MNSLKQKRQGFTIVELIIVIVVIGVLAAITMVSYNGIQDSAREAKLVVAADAYEKILHIYRAQYGSFPAISIPEGVACMGESTDFLAQGGYAEGVCYLYGDGGAMSYEAARVDTALNTELKKVSSGRLPDGSYSSHAFNIEGYAYDMRGLIAFQDSGRIGGLAYVAKDDGSPCAGRFVAMVDGAPPGVKMCELYLE